MQTKLNFITTELLYYNEFPVTSSPNGDSHWEKESNPSHFYVGNIDYKTQILINPNAIKSASQYASIKYVLTAVNETDFKSALVGCSLPFKKDGNKMIFDVTEQCKTLTEETSYELTSPKKELLFFATGKNAPYYEVVPNQVEDVPIKTFDIMPKAKIVADLNNSKTATKITLVKKDSALGKIDVDLVFTQGDKKTSFDEKFTDGIYTDLFGNERNSFEWFYYKDESGEKVIIDNSSVTARLDGTFSCKIDGKEYEVKRLQTLDEKTTVQTELKGVKDASVLNARSEEMQKAKEQYENSKRFIEDVVYGTCSLNSSGKVKIHTYKTFANQANLGASIESVTLDSIVSGREVFLLSTSNFINLKNSVGVYSGGTYIFDEVQEYLLNLAPSVYEDLKTAYNQFVVSEENVNYLKRNTPVNFITANGLHKGFNEFGELVILFTNKDDFVTVNRDRQGKIVSLTDPKENSVNFKYDETGDLEYVYDSRGRVTSLSKAENGDTQITYPDGKVLTVTQNEQGVSQIEYDGVHSSVSYPDGKLLFIAQTDKLEQNQIDSVEVVKTENTVTVTKSNGAQEKLTVEDGKITQKVTIEGGVVTAAVKTEILPNGNFYPSKRVIYAKKDSLFKPESQLSFATGTENDPYGEFSYAEYNDDGNVVSLQEKSNGIESKTCFFYDEDKLLTKKANNYKKTLENGENYEYNKITTYAYDSSKRLVKTVSFIDKEESLNGKQVEEWIYDEFGNLTENFTYNTLDSSSKFYKVESCFDKNGKHVGDKDQTGEHVSKVEYVDGSNLVKTIETPDGTKFSYGYDLADNVTAITQSTADGEENSTQRVYENGLLKKLISGNTVVEYTHDFKGRILSVLVNGVTQKTYEYSADDKTVTQTDLDGNVVTTVSDDFGNVISVAKNGTVIESNVYENGLLKTKVKDRVTHTYNYNDKDELISISYTDGTPTDTFTYDDFGNVTLKTEQGKTTVYIYSDDSLRKLTKATVDGIEFKPTTDVNGRIVESQVKQGETLIEKTATAYIKKGDHATTLPQTVRYWDKALNGYKDSLSYAYDSKGNVTQINQNGKLLAKYTYDGLNRLIREDNVALNKTYLFEYDRTGNITAKRACSFTFEKTNKITEFTSEDIFTYDKDLLVAKNNAICEYVNGRPTKYLGEDIAFAEKGLVSSYRGITFAYDSFGKRTAKGDITFAYDKNGRLVSQSNGITFIYDQAGNKIGFTYGGESYYYRKNIFGDVTHIFKADGTLVGSYTYTAFGKCTIGTNVNSVAFLNPIRYRGYYYDEVSGLYYLNTRYYDADVGRFISPDSVDYLSADKINGLNLYAYCANNPVMKVDPSGQFWLAFLLAMLFTPLGGVVAQVTTSVLSYVGMAVASIFDEDIRADMNAISWNPFNTDESLVVNSNKVSFYKGVPVYLNDSNQGSLSLGAIWLSRQHYEPIEEILKHERGHSTQLMSMGILSYLLQIGLPSVIKNDDNTPWELSASSLGKSSYFLNMSGKNEQEIANFYYVNALFASPVTWLVNLLLFFTT